MLERVKRILLILAVCSTIVENMGGLPLYICIAYFLVSIIDFRSFRVFSRTKEGRHISLLWFVLFLYMFIITGVYSSVPFDASNSFLKWAKALLFFVLILKDTYNQPQLIIEIVFSYVVVALVCATLMVIGIGVEYDPSEIGEERLTFIGTNANKMAMVYVYSFSIALFFLNNLFSRKDKRFFVVKELSLLLFMAVCVYIVANMASRGALICLILTLFIYFLFYQRNNSLLSSILIVTLGLSLIVFGYEYISRIPIFSYRMGMIAEGDLGQRDILVKAAWQIFLDHPLFGVGLTEVVNRIGGYVGTAKTPHNLYLYLLSGGGIIGFSIFMVIIFRSLSLVYKNGYRKNNLLPVLLLVCVLIDYAKNGGALTMSINYVFFAISLSLLNPITEKNSIFDYKKG